MREVYLLATDAAEPVSLEALKGTFSAEEVLFTPLEGAWGFHVQAETTRVEVRFDSRERPMGWTPDLLTGSEESHERLKKARGFYRFFLDAGAAQPSVAVFEALWCVRSVIEHAEGVVVDITAYKLHEGADVVEITELEFDIRDHVNLHAVEAIEGDTPLWVHTHGMEKFGARDVEIFHLGEPDLLPAESFLHELCTDLAFGQGPQLRTEVGTSEGQTFMLVPSEEARANLLGVPLDTFEGHEGLFFTIVSPGGRHNVAELLRPYRERFEGEAGERTEALKEMVRRHLPAFKARFQRKGLMEPITFLVRAPFETHPDGETVAENLWLEVMSWEDETLVGKLVDGAAHTTEWRKGAHVEISEGDVNALALAREGRAMDEQEVTALLHAERPS